MIERIALSAVAGLCIALLVKSYIEERRQCEREMEYLIRLKERTRDETGKRIRRAKDDTQIRRANTADGCDGGMCGTHQGNQQVDTRTVQEGVHCRRDCRCTHNDRGLAADSRNPGREDTGIH